MALRSMTAAELTEYYLLASDWMLAEMTRGTDVTSVPSEVASNLVILAIWRAKVAALNPAVLMVDDATYAPDAATIVALTT